MRLPGHGGDAVGKAEGLEGRARRRGPGREPPPLPVVAVARQRQLGAQQQHAAVEQEGPRVVAHAAVRHGQACVHHQPCGTVAAQQHRHRLPRVRLRVRLQEVVLAAVAGQLQLRPHPERRATRLRRGARRNHPLQVAVEVERPLVEGAGRERRQPRAHACRHPAQRISVASPRTNLINFFDAFGKNSVPQLIPTTNQRTRKNLIVRVNKHI